MNAIVRTETTERTAAVNKNVVMLFSGSSLTNWVQAFESHEHYSANATHLEDVFENGRNDTRGTVRRRCDDTTATGIDFVDGNSITR